MGEERLTHTYMFILMDTFIFILWRFCIVYFTVRRMTCPDCKCGSTMSGLKCLLDQVLSYATLATCVNDGEMEETTYNEGRTNGFCHLYIQEANSTKSCRLTYNYLWLYIRRYYSRCYGSVGKADGMQCNLHLTLLILTGFA